jgi:hypothetical protein
MRYLTHLVFSFRNEVSRSIKVNLGGFSTSGVVGALLPIIIGILKNKFADA